jgi:hypothetical protein
MMQPGPLSSTQLGMDHEHKYNATALLSVGRCRCGALARYDRKTRTYGEPISEYMRKRLESQIRRLSNPDAPHPFFVSKETEPVREREPETTRDVVEELEANDD